eukprot:gene21831-27017_t
MLVLAHESAPTRTILCAGAGTFEAAHITLTQGIHLGIGADVPEQLAARLAEVTERAGEQVPQSGAAQGTNEKLDRYKHMSKLHERLAAYPADALGGIRRGIEKEGLRVLPTGGLALTPHPLALGSALTHPLITTDYSES